MEITIKSGTNSDDFLYQEMDVDGDNYLQIYPLYECPEDATLERDMISCDDVAIYMKLAYEAGKRGEPFEIEEVEAEG